MHVAFVSHKFVRGDGQGRVNFEVARRGLELGYSVSLLASEVDPELLLMGARWVEIEICFKRPNLLLVCEFALKANRALERDRHLYCCIVANGFTLTKQHDLNSAHFVHSAWVKSPAHIWKVRQDLYGLYQLIYSKFNAWTERLAFHASRHIIAVSSRVKDELRALGLPEDKITVIHNGVDIVEFAPRRGARVTSPTAVFVGDIRTTRKNLDTVLKAMRQVPRLRLLVAGSTDRSPFPQLSRDLGVDSRVEFLGFVRDVAKVMQDASLFVFPSRYEACSLVLLEAMATGLPVVTALSTGGSELVSQEAGIVVGDAEDDDEIANAIRMIIDDSKKKTAMGLAARRVAERHTWTRMADEYWKLILVNCGREN